MRRRSGRLWFVLSSLALSTQGCAELTPLEEGVCGNDVAETSRGEDCDCGADAPKRTEDAATCEVSIEGRETPLRCARPGLEHGCRYRCSSVDDCPTGWGCGVDGVCRGLTTDAVKFEILGTAADVGVERIERADFDGDGRDDLLAVASTTASALFYEPNGALAGIETWSTSGVLPAVGHIAGNTAASDQPIDDLALGVGLGVNVFRGRGGRTFLPTTYETLSLADSVGKLTGTNVRIESVASAAATTVESAAGAKTVDAYALIAAWKPQPDKPDLMGTIVRVVRGNAKDPAFHNAAALPAKLPGLPRLPIPSADLDADGLAEIVLAPVTATDVAIVSPFVVGPNPDSLAAPQMVSLRTGLGSTYVAGHAFFYDIDADADLDLLVDATCPMTMQMGPGGALDSNCFELQVSYNDGTGKFGSTQGGPLDGKTSLLLQLTPPDAGQMLPLGANRPYLPLALGDLDGDSLVDVVDGFGVLHGYVPDPPQKIGFVRILENNRASFSDAVVVDANRDGHLDVFAASIDGPDVTFLASDGAGVFTTSYLPTSGPVSQMLSGDFDGDFTTDLAIAEWDGPATGLGAHVFAMSFGKPFGVPDPPVEMSSFEEIVSLSKVPFSVTGADAAEDMTIAFRSTTDTGDVVSNALILGTPTRQFQTPFFLFDVGADQKLGNLRTPQALFAGRFGPAPASKDDTDLADIVAVSRSIANDATKLSFMESSGDGQLTLGPSIALTAISVTNDRDPFLHGLVLNLDGGRDALLLAGNAMDPMGPDQGALALARYVEGEGMKVTEEMSSSQTKLYRSLRAVDLDADKNTDVLAIGYTKQGAGPMSGGGKPGGGGPFYEQQTWLTVFRNSGDGKLCWDPNGPSGCKPIELQLMVDGVAEAVLDVDAINIDGDEAKEIIAITASRVVALELGTDAAGQPTFVEIGPLALSIQEGWSAVRRCDVNGDGVDDLALSQADRLYVYGGVPERR